MPTKTQQERIAKGQCPNCGQEAAPYYLCQTCREIGKIRRICNELYRAGGLNRRMIGGKAHWSIRDNAACDAVIARSRPDAGPNDRRRAPRLNGMRVDVEATLVMIIARIGRPCSMEELVSAWGQLRAKRSGPLAGDLARIIIAQERRQAKNAKRLAQAAVPPLA